MQIISQLSESNEMKKGRRQKKEKERAKNILESKKGKPFAKKQKKRTEKNWITMEAEFKT